MLRDKIGIKFQIFFLLIQLKTFKKLHFPHRTTMNYICAQDARCWCPATPWAEVLTSDHLISMTEQESTRSHVFILKHHSSCYLCKPIWKKRNVCVPQPICKHTSGSDRPAGITFSQAVISYWHELEILPSSLTVLTDESTRCASQR